MTGKHWKSRELWPQLNIACTFPDAVEEVERAVNELDAVVDGGLLPLVQLVLLAVAKWLTA